MQQKLTSSIFTGAKAPYDAYRLLSSDFPEPNLTSYFHDVRQAFHGILEAWSNDLNSEWAARHYLAIKMASCPEIHRSGHAASRW